MYGLCRVRSSAIEDLAALWKQSASRRPKSIHWRINTRFGNAENEAFWGHYVPNKTALFNIENDRTVCKICELCCN